MRPTKSHTHKKQQAHFSVSYILICKPLGSRREGKIFWNEWQKAIAEFNMIVVSFKMQFSVVGSVPKYLKFAPSSQHPQPNWTLWVCLAFCWQDKNIQLSHHWLLDQPGLSSVGSNIAYTECHLLPVFLRD